MRTIVVGEPDTASQLAIGGDSMRAWAAPEPSPPPAEASSAGLATALVAFEDELERRPADLVVLADDSEAALAAALVAAKLEVDVQAVAAARGGASANARLIAQLADTYTEAG